MKNNIFDFLKNRGYVFQYTNEIELKEHLNKGVTFYIGFDPTADSLHVGHFLTMMAIRYLQKAGISPVIVIGGSTALIGDPSGKNQMRKMLSKETIEHNVLCLKKQMEKFISFEGENKAILLNNNDWLSKIYWINFLREFGTCFSVNKMLSFETFKTRLESENGLSFLEFNYMLLQGYDYYYLNKNYGVTLQIGGSDQWTNILSGIEIIRRKENKQAYALTLNLLTKHDGTKMGKSASGAVWLDENKTSPYEFYQYWLNVDDKDVYKFLMLLTSLDAKEIDKLTNVEGKAINEAKKALAYELTLMIHGKEKTLKAIEQSKAAFEKQGSDLFEVILEKNSISDFSIANILVLTKLSPSKSESRRLITSNGISLNNSKVTDVNANLIDLKIDLTNFTLHKGKKHHIKVIIK